MAIILAIYAAMIVLLEGLILHRVIPVVQLARSRL